MIFTDSFRPGARVRAVALGVCFSYCHVQQTIRTRFKECTVITIAHRLSTIMDSDRIFVLDAGELVESGSPADLIAARGAFFELQRKAT